MPAARLARPALTALALLIALYLTVRLPVWAATPAAATNSVYLPLMSCPTCSWSGVITSPTATPTPSEDAAEVLRLVNIERAKVGCPAAVGEPNLMAATQAWAEYMRDNQVAQHATAAWYAPYGYPTGVAENIGSASYPYQIVNAWMNSSGHRANLLWCYPPSDPSYDPNRVYVAGVGSAGGYWVWGLVDILPEDIPTGPLP